MDQFKILRAANVAREKLWDPQKKCDLSFLGNALAGEVGEACNVIKKLERARLGLRGKRANITQLAEELGDVIIYLDILAERVGIDLWLAVRDKFNSSSLEIGSDERI